MYLNIQGLKTHKTQLSWTINQYKPTVICLSETHITNDFTETEINIDGYNTVHNYSKSSHTGGTIIYIKENLKYKETVNIDYNMNMWISGIEITIERQKYYIYSLYHSPGASDAKFLEDLDELFENIKLDGIFILLGDFNIDLASNAFYANKMDGVINKHGFYQLITEYTRITERSKTKIDLLISNKKDIQHKVHLTPKITDHSIISVYLNEQNIETSKTKSFRDYRNMDIMAYQLKLLEMIWQTNSSSTSTLADNLTENLIIALDEYAPKQNKNIKAKWANKLWWNEEIMIEMKERDKLYKRAILTKIDQDWENFKQKRNKVVTLIRTAKITYYNKKIDETKNNSTEMWKTLKGLIKVENKKCPKEEIIFNNKIVSGDEISESFNNFFINSITEIVENIVPSKTHQESIDHISVSCKMEKFCKLEMSELRTIVNTLPNKESNTDGITVKILKAAFETIGDKILNLINTSLENGEFPKNWKLNTIVPIEKKNGTIRSEEFRPINIVPPYEKLLELCVNKQVINYIETNNILSEFQAGFRSKNSCESALQSVLFNWKAALEEGKQIGVVFLDFKRAFETINRQLLLLKMEMYGFGHDILAWFREYLSDRTQVTKYGNISNSKNIKHGVPQGTVLGPTLFILYINDMVKIIKTCNIQLFADDTLIYVTGDTVQNIIDSINEDLNNLLEWLNNNSLELNLNKTKTMIIQNKYNKKIPSTNTDLIVNNTVIERVKKFKYLGCIIDENLTFSEHFSYVTNKVAKKINVLGRVANNVSSWAKMTIYKTIIAPHFYFCSTLLFLMNNSEMDILQKKQNKALRIILGCHKRTSRIDMLEATNLLSVRQTVTFNTMLFIYKMLNQLLPSHLLSNCKFVSDVHEHNTRSNSRSNFYLDKVNTNYSQNSLFYKGLQLYNELPNDIKTSNSVTNFKRKCIIYIKETILI